jgi:hypothetical protein
MQPVTSGKIHFVPIRAIIIMVVFSAIVSGTILSLRSIFHQKSETFQSIDRFPHVSDRLVDRAIKAGVKLDNRITLNYIRQNLTMMEFESGGDRYIVLRIILPETCGKLGCLYIAKPTDDGMAKLLQLQDLPDDAKIFKSASKPGCFTVTQIQHNELKDFPICQEVR